VHYQPQRDLLRNHIILVTGASDGIGKEAALTYARYGARVILLGRNEDKLQAVAGQIASGRPGRQPLHAGHGHLYADDCQRLANEITQHYPRLDGVLHNAGVLGDVCPMSEQQPAVWEHVMQVNVNATFI
jgi:NAD(P)-dependent dehydrogenase (short-subunit alcohol dehydrogenase family)